MELLMDGAARSVIHKHCPAQWIRKTTLQRHSLVRAGTARHGPEAAHNPKVVGSIPTPATNKSPSQSPPPDLGFTASAPHSRSPVPGYRHLTVLDRVRAKV